MGLLDRPFAAVYDRIIASSEQKWLGEARRKMLAGVSGRVLEVGAGTGANFQHYPTDSDVVAIESSPYFMRRAVPRLTSAAVPVRLLQADAHYLPFADDVFDAAVATLVFCTISDPIKAFNEVRRVTRPGGSLLLIEHVNAETRGKQMLLNLWNPCQNFLAGGCNVNRDTESAVSNAGFSIDESRVLMVEMGISRHLLIRATNVK